MLLLDSDVLIDIQRGYQPAVDWFSSLPELPSVPGYVVMELIQDAENKLQVQTAMKLTGPLPVIWPSAADAKRALSALFGSVLRDDFRGDSDVDVLVEFAPTASWSLLESPTTSKDFAPVKIF